MSASNDRLIAARILTRVFGGAFASRLLDRVRAPGVRTRVLGVLRWLRVLDAVLGPRCSRPLGKLEPEVQATLRIGLYEAWQLGVPPAVATDGSVRLARRLGCRAASGLINAVLRRATNEWSRELERLEPQVRLSHPDWLARRWSESFGRDEALRIMEVDQQPAETWVWFHDPGAKDELAASGVELRAHGWCPGAWSAPGEARALVTQVEAGRAYAQDPGSQLVAHLGDRLAVPGDRLLDLCAAPGGKTALLVGRRRWQRAAAFDIWPRRAALLRDLLKRTGGGAVAVVADSTGPPVTPGAWDLVLLDAPCSGTGVLRRHPELRWRLSEEALVEMVANQRRLLAAAWPLVAPGGVLVYSTCSLEPEENEQLLGHIPTGFEVAGVAEHMPDGPAWVATAVGGVRLLPAVDCDGFTIHAFRRVEAQASTGSGAGTRTEAST